MKTSTFHDGSELKACSCGRDFTPEQWGDLELVGHQSQFTEDGEIDQNVGLELRNCVCGSTLSVEVPR